MKRFTSDGQIIKMIDQYKVELVTLAGRIGDYEFLMTRLVGTCEANRIPEMRDQVEAMRRKLSWRETRLKNLGQKLAEFQTMLLPGVEGDASVPTS